MRLGGPLLTEPFAFYLAMKSIYCDQVLWRPCCIMLPSVLVYFRPFTNSPGSYTQHGRDIKRLDQIFALSLFSGMSLRDRTPAGLRIIQPCLPSFAKTPALYPSRDEGP